MLRYRLRVSRPAGGLSVSKPGEAGVVLDVPAFLAGLADTILTTGGGVATEAKQFMTWSSSDSSSATVEPPKTNLNTG